MPDPDLLFQSPSRLHAPTPLSPGVTPYEWQPPEVIRTDRDTAKRLLLYYRTYNSVLPYDSFINPHRFSRWNARSDAIDPKSIEVEIPEIAPPETLAENDATVVNAYQAALLSGGKLELSKILTTIRDTDSLSIDQRLTLVQMFGLRFRQGYDSDRNSAGLFARGKATLDELLEVAAHNTQIGFYGVSTGAEEYAGVCRDIASAQAWMLKQLGFKDTFVVAFVNESDWHTTVVTRDPNRPRQIYKLDYENRRLKDSARPGSNLYQGDGDMTLTYYLAKPEGAVVGAIASDKYKILHELGGGQISYLDPLALANNSIAQVAYNFGNGEWGTVRAFTANDQSPTSMAGAALNLRWGDDDSMLPGSVGFVLAWENRPASGTQHGLGYVQLEQKFVPLDVTWDDGNYRLRGEIVVDLAFMAGWTLNGPNRGNIVPVGDGRATAQIELEQNLLQKRLRLRYAVGGQIIPSLRDIRNIQTGTAALNVGFFKVGAAYQPSANIPVTLVAGGDLVVSQLSVRGRVQAGVVIDRFSLMGYVAGRLDRDMPVYEDQASQVVGINFQASPFSHLSFGVDAAKSLENSKVWVFSGGLKAEW